MPFGIKPVCSKCSITDSTVWRPLDPSCPNNGSVVCHECFVKQHGQDDPNAKRVDRGKTGTEGDGRQDTRKSTRLKPSKLKSQNAMSKGKSRRTVFKKNPIKAPPAVASATTADYVFFEGFYWQIGDVVSVVDVDDGDVYYAQISGFLQDQYSTKSAVLTWLIPTVPGLNRDMFDPAVYKLGPSEELPRNMDCLRFVCHASTNYFSEPKTSSLDHPDGHERGFIWTRLGQVPGTGRVSEGEVEVNVDVAVAGDVSR